MSSTSNSASSSSSTGSGDSTAPRPGGRRRLRGDTGPQPPAYLSSPYGLSKFDNKINGTIMMTKYLNQMLPTCSDKTDWRCLSSTPCDSRSINDNCTWSTSAYPPCSGPQFGSNTGCTSDIACSYSRSGQNCTFDGTLDFVYMNLTWVNANGSTNASHFTNINGAMIPQCNRFTQSNCTDTQVYCYKDSRSNNWSNCTWYPSWPLCDGSNYF